MAQTAKKTLLSPDEFLEMEEKSDTKHEYYRGEIFNLAGASIAHNTIVSNCVSGLHTSFRNKSCRVYSNDLKVRIEAVDLFTYPDILVICGKPQLYKDRDDTVMNPVLIVEVLSESTKNYDRGEKFEFYRQIASLQDYILIDQYKLHVEHFSLGAENKWVLSEYSDRNDIVRAPAVDFDITLAAIYERVEFSKS